MLGQVSGGGEMPVGMGVAVWSDLFAFVCIKL